MPDTYRSHFPVPELPQVTSITIPAHLQSHWTKLSADAQPFVPGGGYVASCSGFLSNQSVISDSGSSFYDGTRESAKSTVAESSYGDDDETSSDTDSMSSEDSVEIEGSAVSLPLFLTGGQPRALPSRSYSASPFRRHHHPRSEGGGGQRSNGYIGQKYNSNQSSGNGGSSNGFHSKDKSAFFRGKSETASTLNGHQQQQQLQSQHRRSPEYRGRSSPVSRSSAANNPTSRSSAGINNGFSQGPTRSSSQPSFARNHAPNMTHPTPSAPLTVSIANATLVQPQPVQPFRILTPWIQNLVNSATEPKPSTHRQKVRKSSNSSTSAIRSPRSPRSPRSRSLKSPTTRSRQVSATSSPSITPTFHPTSPPPTTISPFAYSATPLSTPSSPTFHSYPPSETSSTSSSQPPDLFSLLPPHLLPAPSTQFAFGAQNKHLNVSLKPPMGRVFANVRKKKNKEELHHIHHHLGGESMFFGTPIEALGSGSPTEGSRRFSVGTLSSLDSERGEEGGGGSMADVSSNAGEGSVMTFGYSASEDGRGAAGGSEFDAEEIVGGLVGEEPEDVSEGRVHEEVSVPSDDFSMDSEAPVTDIAVERAVDAAAEETAENSETTPRVEAESPSVDDDGWQVVRKKAASSTVGSPGARKGRGAGKDKHQNRSSSTRRRGRRSDPSGSLPSSSKRSSSASAPNSKVSPAKELKSSLNMVALAAEIDKLEIHSSATRFSSLGDTGMSGGSTSSDDEDITESIQDTANLKTPIYRPPPLEAHGEGTHISPTHRRSSSSTRKAGPKSRNASRASSMK
ncbi:hypothetical protein HDV05_000005 [Chytridiales sp. JEL 0842]|nr:hypothetical protein HDV05_000005 [Chytridiales sp. JEL 0842]